MTAIMSAEKEVAKQYRLMQEAL